MRILLAGLWSRRGLNAACLLAAVTACAASLVGPMYSRSAAEHLLDTRVEQRPPYVTGLSYSVPAVEAVSVPVGDPGRYQPPDPGELIAAAATKVTAPGRERFWQPPTEWVLDPGGQLEFSLATLEVPLLWREGMCELAVVDGRCPKAEGEALVEAAMAASLDKKAGDTISLTYSEQWLEINQGVRAVQERPVRRTFAIVGTYQVSDADTRSWYDPSLVTRPGDLGFAGSTPGNAGAPPLLVSPESMTSQTFVGGVDRALDTARTGIDDLGRVAPVIEANVVALQEKAESVAGSTDARVLFKEVRDERRVLSSVTTVALAPLVVLALLLLHALVAAAADVRRPYVALAKLRGHSRRQVLWFGVAEPFLVIALAIPVGGALAWLVTRVVSGWWLAPDVPLVLDTMALASFAVVTGGALVAAAAAVLSVLREPLSVALAGAAGTGGSSRWSLVLRGGVVALALGTGAQLVNRSSSGSGGQILELLTPLFVALAAGVAGVSLLTFLAQRWSRATVDRGGTPSFLAARRLARRKDLTRILVPTLLAVSVITFATSASATADDWRLSRARATVGAPTVFDAAVDPGRLLQVTRDVDPDGRYLAAAVVEEDPRNGMARRTLVDVSRLAKVAAWHEDWSSASVEELQRRLTPETALPTLTMRGRALELRLRDIRLRSDGVAVLWIQYRTSEGNQVRLQVGDLRNGTSQVLASVLEGCERPCLVEQVYITGSSASLSDAQGELVLAGASVDGRPADWRLDRPGAWRAARPFPFSVVDPPVVLEPSGDGLRMAVYLGQPPARSGNPPLDLSGVAAITPGDVPDILPVVTTEATSAESIPVPVTGLGHDYPDGVVEGFALNGLEVPMRVVGTTKALPGVGDEGTLADLEASLREFAPPAGVTLDVELWVAEGAPTAIVDAVEEAGVVLSNRASVDEMVTELSSDAFNLGWRIFLLVGAATLLLAVFGILAATAVQARWRAYEVAALRVVGVRSRDLVRASVLEHRVALGLAVVLGVGAALVSTSLVVPVLDLGAAGPHDPEVVVTIHWVTVLTVAAGLFAVTVSVTTMMARRMVRRAVPATLRSADRG